MKQILRIICLVMVLALTFSLTILAAPPIAGGPITSPYGPRDGTLHKGVDIGVPMGTPVVAPWDGVCEGAPNGGYGYWVTITNTATGETWLFGDLSSASEMCARGNVKEGDIIGYIGGAFDYEDETGNDGLHRVLYFSSTQHRNGSFRSLAFFQIHCRGYSRTPFIRDTETAYCIDNDRALRHLYKGF